jgi:hypothetical protein
VRDWLDVLLSCSLLQSPFYQSVNMSLWETGNTFVGAAHDVYQRYQQLAASGADLQGDKQARFVSDNGPSGLFRGWEVTLDGLLLQTLRMVVKVGC